MRRSSPHFIQQVSAPWWRLITVVALVMAMVWHLTPSVAEAVDRGIAVTVYGDGTTPLPGATVTATVATSPPFSGAVAGSCVTDDLGSCQFAVDANGSYDIRVTGAPPGFAPVEQVWLGSAFGSAEGYGTMAYQQDQTGTRAPDPVIVNNNVPAARLVVQRSNPPFPSVCGLDIAIIIDRSGSTLSTEAQYREAAKQFVQAMVGTPSRIGIWTFAATAQGLAPGLSGLTDVNLVGTGTYNYPGGKLAQAIDAVPSAAGGTNWDAGILQAAGSLADLVIVVTDGNPTTQTGFWNADTGSTGTVNVYDVEGGVASANRLKAEGARIIGIGIGNLGGNPPVNLLSISGPVAGSDYYTGKIEDLGALLRGIALELCGGTVIVEKRVETAPDVTTLANGWGFSGVITRGGGSALPTSGVTSTVNDVPGQLAIKFQGGTWTKDVQILEQVQSGYSLTSVACSIAAQPIATTPVEVGGARGVAFTIDMDDTVNCVFVNRPTLGSITVIKQAVPEGEQSFRFSTGGTGLVAFDLVDRGDGNNWIEFDGLYPGIYSLMESETLGWTRSVPSCSGEGVSVETQLGGAIITFTPTGGAVTCEFTNTKIYPDLAIEKSGPATVFAGGLLEYNIAVTNLGPVGAETQRVTDTLPVGLIWHQVPTAGEPADGWACETDGQSVECERQSLLGAGDTTSLRLLARLAPDTTWSEVENCATVEDEVLGDENDSSCASTKVEHGSVTVSKQVEGVAPGRDWSFTFRLEGGPFTGAANQVLSGSGPSAASSSAIWGGLVPGVTYTLTEVGQPEWLQAMSCSLVGGGSVVDYAPTPNVVAFIAGVGQSLTCAAVNEPQPATITVTKVDDVTEPVRPSETFSYRIEVKNNGPSQVADVAIYDDVPATLIVTGAAGSGWSCSVTNNFVSCSYGATLAAGASTQPVTISVRVSEPFEGTLVEGRASVRNVVRAEASYRPGARISAEDDETTPIRQIADLAIVKSSPDLDRIVLQTAPVEFDWVLTVTNAGPDAATGVAVSDELPAGLSVISVTSSGFSCLVDGLRVLCTRSALAPGASDSIVIRVSVPVTTPAGTVVNLAAVSSDVFDPHPGDNTSRDEVAIERVEALAPTPSPLPPTGADATSPIWIGIVVAGAGLLMVAISRRRRLT